MPELPEIETIRQGLTPILKGQKLHQVILRCKRLRFPVPDNLTTKLQGKYVERLERRAKYLLIYFEGNFVLLVHLGMSGRFLILDNNIPEPGSHDHLDLVNDNGCTIRFHDPRRFGFLDLVRADLLDTHPALSNLGPEPLSHTFNGSILEQQLAKRRGPIKTVLLNQKVVAGLGNIYVCESLFHARISPWRNANSVAGIHAERLAQAIRQVLKKAIAAGGSSLRDYRKPDGALGYFQHTFAVYGREGKTCPDCDCDVTLNKGIARLVQSGRSTFWCSRKQQ